MVFQRVAPKYRPKSEALSERLNTRQRDVQVNREDARLPADERKAAAATQRSTPWMPIGVSFVVIVGLFALAGNAQLNPMSGGPQGDVTAGPVDDSELQFRPTRRLDPFDGQPPSRSTPPEASLAQRPLEHAASQSRELPQFTTDEFFTETITEPIDRWRADNRDSQILSVPPIPNGQQLHWQSRQAGMPAPQPDQPIVISGADAAKWREGEYDVWHVVGPFSIRQGDTIATAHEALLWIDQGDPYIGEPDKVIAYLEGNTRIDFEHSGQRHSRTGKAAQTIESQAWLGRFTTVTGMQLDVIPTRGRPEQIPEIYTRAKNHHHSDIDPSVIPTQFQVPVGQGPGSTLPANQDPNRPTGISGIQAGPVQTPRTNVNIGPRAASVDPNVRVFDDDRRAGQIVIADRGVKITIQSTEFAELMGQGPLAAEQAAAGGDYNTVVILADRILAWTNQFGALSGQDVPEGTPERWEFYLEGNIVFAFAERVIYAERMYYDAITQRGTILNAEMLTPVPDYEGLVRLRADVLEQVDRETFRAYQAAVTSSRMGYPKYWMQAGDVEVSHRQAPLIDPYTGAPATDARTGQPIYDHQYLAQSDNNFVYVGGTPVFYWPRFATDFSNPSYYLTGLSVKNDSVYGTQFLTEWDWYQLLGIRNPPEGSEWRLNLDYLSERGPAFGSDYTYEGDRFLGFNGPYRGSYSAWTIYDQGQDNLGIDRRALQPPEELRGRMRLQHQQYLDIGYQVTAEAGLLRDRNFLEQYFEQEWDQDKDQDTRLEIKRIYGTQSFNLWGQVAVHDFFAATDWWPRFDHYVLGQPLLFDRVNWSAHSHVGYGRLNVAEEPTDPADGKFRLLPWEQPVEGVRAGTRHELSLPFAAGPAKITPFISGDATYWEEALNSQSVTRLMGQAGVRANLPIWKSDPTVQNELFNINGLAHKIDLGVEAFWSDASENLEDLALYDPLDDNAQEQFRRRFGFDTFMNGVVPLQFDERFYALRRGMQTYVTSPSAEVGDDLAVTRLGLRQRWQTKRGFAGQRRVVDVVALDLWGSYFPEADRDNFGSDFGMVDYDFRWNIGDRFAILSDGHFDMFEDGLRTASIGATTNRPELGSLYVGLRSIEGPISSNILTSSVSYRMSHKWVATAGTAIDFGETGNIGQSLDVTRVGESFLMKLGVRADASRGNFGLVLGFEPRFMPRDRMDQLDGVYIPPPGVNGVE